MGMIRKGLLAATALGAALTFTGTSAVAKDSGLSVEVGVVTDYVDRGLTLSSGDPSVQGEVSYSFDPGFYLKAWGASVDFDDGKTSVEVILTGGYAFDLGPIGADFSATRYIYPNAPSNADYDIWEFGAEFSGDAGPVELAVGFLANPEIADNGGAALYTVLSASVSLLGPMSLEGHVGRQMFDRNDLAGPDYTDWLLGVRWGLGPVTLGLDYTDTDLSDRDCGGGCGARFVAFVRASF